MKKNFYWLAVQPTPYNFILYKELKKSSKFDFTFCFSIKQEKNLPFDYDQMVFKDDYVFRKILGIDFNILFKAFFPDTLFMVVGWNDKTKVLLMCIRKLLGMKYYFWTDSINEEKTKTGNRIAFRFKKWLLTGAKIVFTTGSFGVEKMLGSGLVIDKAKVSALPFFVSIPEHINVKVFNPDKEPLQLLQLSRLMHGKGLFITIDAIRMLLDEGYNIQYTIGGVGHEQEALQKYIESQRLQDNVRLLGWLDENAKIDNVNKAHCLIHCVDEHDPFPLVVLESLALGLPVIGTLKAGSVADRVINGYNGIVVEDNPISIASGIKPLFNALSVESLSKGARQTGENWPVSKGLEIIEEVIN